MDTKKFQVPENFAYKPARDLFKNPKVTAADAVKTSWSKPDETGLNKFLVEQSDMTENGAKGNVKKLVKLFEVNNLFGDAWVRRL